MSEPLNTAFVKGTADFNFWGNAGFAERFCYAALSSPQLAKALLAAELLNHMDRVLTNRIIVPQDRSNRDDGLSQGGMKKDGETLYITESSEVRGVWLHVCECAMDIRKSCRDFNPEQQIIICGVLDACKQILIQDAVMHYDEIVVKQVFSEMGAVNQDQFLAAMKASDQARRDIADRMCEEVLQNNKEAACNIIRQAILHCIDSPFHQVWTPVQRSPISKEEVNLAGKIQCKGYSLIKLEAASLKQAEEHGVDTVPIQGVWDELRIEFCQKVLTLQGIGMDSTVSILNNLGFLGSWEQHQIPGNSIGYLDQS